MSKPGPFAVVLSEAESEERFRTTISAASLDAALAKAARLAERLHADVELVEPMRNLPIAQVMPLAEEPAEDAAQARGSDGAE